MSGPAIERWQWEGPKLLRTARTEAVYTFEEIPINLERTVTLALLFQFDIDKPPPNDKSLTLEMHFWLQDKIGGSDWHNVSSCRMTGPGQNLRASMRISSPLGEKARLAANLSWSTSASSGDPNPTDELLEQLAARNIRAWVLVRNL